jgi:hypothetical protein
VVAGWFMKSPSGLPPLVDKPVHEVVMLGQHDADILNRDAGDALDFHAFKLLADCLPHLSDNLG